MQYYPGTGYIEDPAAWYDTEVPPANSMYNKSVQGGMYSAQTEMGLLYAGGMAGRTKYQETEESKAKYRILLRDILNGKDSRTTLMIKNIPNKYNQKMLLQKIDLQNKNQYNFFYLPLDFKVVLLRQYL